MSLRVVKEETILILKVSNQYLLHLFRNAANVTGYKQRSRTTMISGPFSKSLTGVINML